MALSALTPQPATSDLVTVKEAVLLLQDTPYPVSESTIKRWIRRHQMTVKRPRGVIHVSFSDVLEVHRDEYARVLAMADGR